MKLPTSHSATELDDPPPVPFRWAPGRKNFQLARRFALGRHFLARFAAGLCLLVKRLRHRGGTADLTDTGHLNFELAAVVADAQHIAESNFACRFGELAVGENPPQLTGFLGQGPGLEETGRPQPGIHSYSMHVLSHFWTCIPQ